METNFSGGTPHSFPARKKGSDSKTEPMGNQEYSLPSAPFMPTPVGTERSNLSTIDLATSIFKCPASIYVGANPVLVRK